MEFVGIDWATRRAAWCAVDAAGRRLGEGAVPADESGLLRLVADRGNEVTAAVEMMSGSAWVAETLRGVGWGRACRGRAAGAGAGAAGGEDRSHRRAGAGRARAPAARAGCVGPGAGRSRAARAAVAADASDPLADIGEEPHLRAVVAVGRARRRESSAPARGDRRARRSRRAGRVARVDCRGGRGHRSPRRTAGADRRRTQPGRPRRRPRRAAARFPASAGCSG